MFSVEPAVPVYFGIVEAECAVCFADFDVHVVGTGEDFVFEGAILAFLTNVVDFVDDGSYSRVLIYQDLADEVLVL